jgi:hypothetical protein
LSLLFKTIFLDNAETLASVCNSLKLQNEEKIRDYLREHNLEKAKIDELIVLSDERNGEAAIKPQSATRSRTPAINEIFKTNSKQFLVLKKTPIQ